MLSNAPHRESWVRCSPQTHSIKCSSCDTHPPFAPPKNPNPPLIPSLSQSLPSLSLSLSLSLSPPHNKWRIPLQPLLFFFSLLPNTTTTTTTTMSSYFANLGLGYSIAIALAFLVLLSTLILSSYLCCRASNRRNNTSNPNNNPNTSDGVILPRVIFVAEDDEEEQRGEENAAVGLDDNVINSYPRFQFSRDAATTVVGQNTMCSICLCEYKDSEMLRMMPECRHYFHLCCLDSWLKLNGSCPVCRNSPLPTPLSTPLQEVVPLSQYAADRRRRR